MGTSEHHFSTIITASGGDCIGFEKKKQDLPLTVPNI